MPKGSLILPTDSFGVAGVLTARIAVPRGELHRVKVSGVRPVGRLSGGSLTRRARGRIQLDAEIARREQNPYRIPLLDADLLLVSADNAFTNLGLHYVLDRIFNINTPSAAITHMGLSDDTTAVTATTLLIDPTAGAGSPDFQALGSGVGASATTRTGNTVSATAGWEPADFSTLFSITKVGLSTASTDAGDDTVPTVNGVISIIGGTGGASPYNEPFTINLTTVSDFDLTLQYNVTGQAT